ncbi:MAG: SigE family RNA polymerase sigma factor [Actinobacteria bacterium]|nr:SigE family RNA polymerase sigma factor [Actinomycetota bacterium]
MDKNRDAEFAMFFRTEYPGVVRTAYLVLHDREAANDVAQDAFAKILSHWGRVSRYDRPDAWVRKVAVRMAIKLARRQRLHVAAGTQPEPTTEQAPVDLDLMRAIRALPAAQRAAVVLFYFEDRPVAEVAEIMDCSASTAKVHLHRARRRLSEQLGEAVADVS